MKKWLWAVLAVAALVALVLFIPIPRGSYDDGGTREYEALAYKIVHWNRMTDNGVYEKTRVYWGDDKARTIDELWAEETARISALDNPPVTKTLDFEAQYIRTDGYHEELRYPSVKLIRSVEELNAYYEANKTLYDLERRDDPAADSTIVFLDACDQYDDAFFEDHRLILVLLEEGSGSTRHKVTAVRQNQDGELTVDIETIVPEVGTCDMALWHIFVETTADIESEKAVSLSFAGDRNDVKAVFSKDFANITLPMPDGWEHEITDSGIRFWPSGYSEGKLHVYFSSGFGVCGTGLSSKTITLGGYEANQGTYDGKDVWDFICLQNTPGDYVIMNEGADVWWDDHGDEAMAILNRISVAEGILPQEKAIDIAKAACTIEYVDIHASFDSQNGTWCVNFGQGVSVLGGDQTVITDAVLGTVLDSVHGE